MTTLMEVGRETIYSKISTENPNYSTLFATVDGLTGRSSITYIGRS